ncbi:hypothetical protein [Streptomyces lycii]|uniref:Lipoprotein n=1 Tax=Streptomyces lycii TaxID=2654337 RepID=A0ABQ7FBA5_9ACTN|nr:hypothetical protein [Streptomyces lycii]KAF4405096.1 hypothetical protein GCU69_32130 [Streptomyces lycii]
MTHRHLTAAAALTACTALLLSGCGSGDDPEGKSDDKIAGAEDASSSSPSASAPDDSKRPSIKLPKDDVLIFENRKTGDPKKDAVLSDNEQRLRAIDAAIIEGDPESEPVYFYSARDAAVSAAKSIQSYVDDDLSVTGTVRYFDRSVTFRSDGSARLTYCSDETKGFAKERKTGKVLQSAPDENSYVFYDTRLDRNEAGVWQTTGVKSQRGAEQCQP